MFGPPRVRPAVGSSARRLVSASSSGPSTNRNGRKLNNARPTSSDADKLADGERVKVAIRCRPISEKELKDGHQSIVEPEDEKTIVVHDISEPPSKLLGTQTQGRRNSTDRKNYSKVYQFDRVFDTKSTQEEIYEQVCRPVVASVLQGYNGTIFAYGQTGTGKTYTMEGREKDNIGSGIAASSGIIPRTFRQIFEHIASNEHVQFLVRASYLEIYQEEIRDLLKKNKQTNLELHERDDVGVYVQDLTSYACKSEKEIERVMRVGNQNRMVGATDMNEHSSRSHAIFMITVEQQQQQSKGASEELKQSSTTEDRKSINGRSTATSSGKAIKNNDAKRQQQCKIRVGKLNLVDLAGCERQRKTNSSGQRQKESININLSLSALGNVINSLTKLQNNNTKGPAGDRAQIIHVPYRDSKLTRLLQDSLGGNSKTLMIANIGPANYNYEETINTLNYASRARCIRNKPRLNEDPKDTLLRELRNEIQELRLRLAQAPNGTTLDGGLKVEKSEVEYCKYDEDELLKLRKKLFSLEDKLLNNHDKSRALAADSIERSDDTRIESLLDLVEDEKTLKGVTKEQELELEKRRKELEARADRERAIRDELNRGEELELNAKKSFDSIQQEIEAKRNVIKEILLKVKSVRDEIDERQATYRLELDELDQLQYVLQKELKLKCLIMDNFIPNSHVDQLLDHIVYDDRQNRCYIEQSAYLSSSNANGSPACGYVDLIERQRAPALEDFWRPTFDSIRPRSEFERLSETIYPNNIRYKYENLIEPQLEPVPTDPGKDCDLSGEQKSDANEFGSRLQTLIAESLNLHEADIVIE